MNLERKKGDVLYEYKEIPKTGIIFLSCDWSMYAIRSLQNIISILDDFNEINLYVYDIDRDTYELIRETYPEAQSHGYGEMFWVLNGEIISKCHSKEISKQVLIENTQHLLKRMGSVTD